MAFDTYTEISSGADTVMHLIAENRTRLNRAKGEFSAIITILNGLSAQYGPMVGAIETIQAADPTNAAKTALKAHVTQLLADFTSLQAEVAALDTEVNT